MTPNSAPWCVGAPWIAPARPMGGIGVVSVTLSAEVTKNAWRREGVESHARGRGRARGSPVISRRGGPALR